MEVPNMRTAIIIVLLMGLFSGCNDGNPMQPVERPTVFVNFVSGLQLDSVITRLDGKILWCGRIDSNFSNGTKGILFLSSIGFHIFSTELPLKHVGGAVFFTTSTEFQTLIEVYFDRTEKRITYKVHYSKAVWRDGGWH